MLPGAADDDAGLDGDISEGISASVGDISVAQTLPDALIVGPVAGLLLFEAS
jgi:hypothetical protein